MQEKLIVKTMHEQIHAARVAAGLSLSQAGRRAGIDPAEIHKLDIGRKTNPTLRTLRRVATALEMRELVLPGWDDTEPLTIRFLETERTTW